MTYYLSLADARLLFNMACTLSVRSDYEHEAIYNLAVWLDEHDPQPGDQPQYREWAVDSREEA